MADPGQFIIMEYFDPNININPAQIPVPQGYQNYQGYHSHMMPIGDQSYMNTKVSYNHPSTIDEEAIAPVLNPPKRKPKKGNYVCPICGRCLAASYCLQVHMRLHTGERPYKCSFCEKAYVSKTDLRTHTRRHTGEKPYKCDQCGKEFYVRGTLNAHLKSHSSERPYGCNYCHRKFKCEESLTRHLQQRKDDRCPMKGPNVNGDGLKSCLKCNVEFENSMEFRQHNREQHGGLSYHQCQECHMVIKTAQQLKRHMMIHRGELPYECPICKKRTRTIGAHNVHMKMWHYTEGKLTCETCGKKFISQSRLKDHAVLHTGIKAFKCQICQKAFPTRKHLKFHMRIHNDENTCVPCGICGKMVVGYNAKNHEKMCKQRHDHRERSECNVCGTFVFDYCHKQHEQLCKTKHRVVCHLCGKMVMNTSMRGHLLKCRKTSVFRCPICNETFGEVVDLTSHMSFHGVEDCNYQCILCDKFFLTVHELRAHEDIHTLNDGNECKLCGHFLKSRLLLQEHLKVHAMESLDADILANPQVMAHVQTSVYKCGSCEKVFGNNPVAIHQHQKLHFHGMPHCCALCQKRFLWKIEYLSHISPGTVGQLRCRGFQGKFLCEICGSIGTIRQLRIHELSHTLENSWECSVCNQFFEPTQKQMHMKLHRMTKDKDGTAEHRLKDLHSCTQCGKSFRKKDFDFHQKLHLHGSPHVCNICGITFMWNVELRKHVLQIHKTVGLAGMETGLQTAIATALSIEDNNLETDSIQSTSKSSNQASILSQAKVKQILAAAHRAQSNGNLMPGNNASSAKVLLLASKNSSGIATTRPVGETRKRRKKKGRWCPFCQKVKNPDLDHKLQCGGQSSGCLNCVKCGKTFLWQYKLDSHMEACHRVTEVQDGEGAANTFETNEVKRIGALSWQQISASNNDGEQVVIEAMPPKIEKAISIADESPENVVVPNKPADTCAIEQLIALEDTANGIPDLPMIIGSTAEHLGLTTISYESHCLNIDAENCINDNVNRSIENEHDIDLASMLHYSHQNLS